MKKIVPSSEGFTLIEVMIALGVLSIGIIAMMVMQGTGIKGNATANTITSASVYAGDAIERLFEMDYDLVVDADGDGNAGLGDATAATADGNEVSPDGSYALFWNVVEDEPMPLTKKVRIIVTRLERGQTRTVAYNYIKASVVDN